MMNPNSGGRAAPADTAAPARTAPTRVEPRTPQQRSAEARSPEARPAEVRAPEVRPAEPAARTSVLGPTLRFRGELSAQEDLLIQGSVEGSITHTQCLTVGTDGSMKGDIRARVIVVDGKVDGDLYATESVSIRATAKVKGNLFAPRVGIAEGAFFQGQIEMQPSGAAVQEHSARLRQATTSAPQSEGSTPEQLRSGSQG